jgi:hypothetical protein
MHSIRLRQTAGFFGKVTIILGFQHSKLNRQVASSDGAWQHAQTLIRDRAGA